MFLTASAFSVKFGQVGLVQIALTCFAFTAWN